MTVPNDTCLFCRQPAPAGEWHCVACEGRLSKRATEEEAKRHGGNSPGKASTGTSENQQYGDARPVAKGRVGDFPPFEEVKKKVSAIKTRSPNGLGRHVTLEDFDLWNGGPNPVAKS